MSKKTTLAVMAFGLILALTSCSTTPPYKVVLEEIVNDSLPHLHSYTHATYGDKIILFGGRKRGLHQSGYNFSQSSENHRIYVIDTKSWQVHSRPDSLLLQTDSTGVSPFENMGQFSANNAEFFTQDSTLYVVGGLQGAVNTTIGPVTLPLFTAINLPALVNAVLHDTILPPGNIQQVSNPAFAITGGEVGMMGNTVYLAFGWNTNVYTHQVSSFTFNNSLLAGLTYTFNPLCPTCQDDSVNTANGGNFRRRDGSMSPMIDPSDTTSQAFLYYSGVFKNGNTNFDTPVWIKNDSVQEDTSFHMRSNVYTCMVLPFYSRQNHESYATLLGGMTNGSNGGGAITNGKPRLMDNTTAPITPPDLVNFLSIPFSNQLTTIVIDKNRNMTQYLLPDSFPQLTQNITIPTPPSSATPTVYTPSQIVAHNGAEAEMFWTVDNSFLLSNGVIDYDNFVANNTTNGVVGYLFGGILSIVNNSNMNGPPIQGNVTIASNRLFAVKIVPYPKPWWQF